ncbi:50S ribosomal protein L25 [Urbifossiella limnaea]|uniref:Large ribosomal subunit protein bL25 n=1 Tax=Urbifossiella limnaea TaxID=2528023 RepID=A0A517Y135_9BACT|nr:50S ribosomal protein L25 [Urbifossiella limnaea]QDU23471.1 50S ribosomal protein L25 [Urbifossiella limnaea]
MAETATLKAEPRTGSGSRQAGKLRKAGRVPAIVYGHKEANVAVSVAADELDRLIRVQHARVLNLDVGGKTETVLVRDLQWDHLGRHMLHVDFARVSASDRVRVTIPVELRNSPKQTGGGVLDQPLHTLHVECSPTAIPESIRIDITGLTLGAPIHVRELALPAGVTVLEAPEAVVVQLKLPGAEPAVAVVPEPGTGPEVIKKEKKADDEADDDKKKK